MTWCSLEFLATIFNILFILYAARNNIWCWFFGLIGSSLFLWVVFSAGLYADSILQLFYIGMAIYGWYSWKKVDSDEKKFLRGSAVLHGYFLLLGLVLTAILLYLGNKLGASYPFLDALTTAFAIIATYLQAKKYIENWLYWIIIDLVGIYIYYQKGLYWFLVLFSVYTLMAIYGYYHWNKGSNFSRIKNR